MNRIMLTSNIGMESIKDIFFLTMDDLINLNIDDSTAKAMIQDVSANRASGFTAVQWQDKKIMCRFAPEHCSAILSEFSKTEPRCSELTSSSTPTNSEVATRAIALFNLGQQAFSQGEWWEAVKQYKKAIVQQPEYGVAHAQLGIVLYHLEMYNDAAVNLEKSIAFSEMSAIARSNVNHHLSLVRSKISANAFLDTHNVKIVADRKTLLQISIEAAFTFLRLHDLQLTRAMFLEFGVYYGDSAKMIATLLDNSTNDHDGSAPILDAFDSFHGLPEQWNMNSSHPTIGFAPTGTFRVLNASKLIKDLIKSYKNLKVHVGLFQTTLKSYLHDRHRLHEGSVVAFAHIDCDLYSSTKFVLNALKPYLRKGSVLQFDELVGWPGWNIGGEFRALEELMKTSGVAILFMYSAGQAVSCVVDDLR